jgi:hypothetical protein
MYHYHPLCGVTALSTRISSREVLSLDDTVAAVKEQVSCALGKDTVILHLANGTYYSLNEVGSSVWNYLQTPRTVEQVRNLLLEEYCVEPSQCEQDLLALLESMISARLITLTAEPSEPDAFVS